MAEQECAAPKHLSTIETLLFVPICIFSVYLQYMLLQNLLETWKSFSLVRKIALVVVSMVALLVGLIIISILSSARGSLLGVGQGGNVPIPGMSQKVGGYGVASLQSPDSYNAYESYGGRGVMYSTPSVTTSKAEDFELTSYQVTIESRNIEEDCQSIQSLKADESIIFLSANTSKDSCSFSFKAEKQSAKKAIAVIKALDPKNFIENVRTIEDTLISYDKRKEILETELATIQKILDDALVSYEALSKLAITTGSVTNLRQAIYDKVDIIERLTQKKLSIEQELRQTGDAISSNKGEMQYEQFSVSIYKNTFVDKEALISSWKYEVKQFINEINASAQALTIGLIMFIFMLVKYILYFLVIVVIVKYLKKIVVYIWKKE